MHHEWDNLLHQVGAEQLLHSVPLTPGSAYPQPRYMRGHVGPFHSDPELLNDLVEGVVVASRPKPDCTSRLATSVVRLATSRLT